MKEFITGNFACPVIFTGFFQLAVTSDAGVTKVVFEHTHKTLLNINVT
jgi:hypothetical protein